MASGMEVGIRTCHRATSLLSPGTVLPPPPQAVLFLLGNPIILPMDTLNLELPEFLGRKNAMATLALSQNLFDSILLLLQKAGALNLDITAHLVSKACSPCWPCPRDTTDAQSRAGGAAGRWPLEKL